MLATYKQARVQSYIIKNSGDSEKTVLVEHPIDLQWELRAPKEPTEKTRDVYRFAVAVKPGEPADLKIEEEQMIRQEVAVHDLDINAIRVYLGAKTISEVVREALSEVVRRRIALTDLNRQKQQVEQQITVIDQEQARIRENMRTIDRNSDLYRRYVDKFTEQENQIEKLRAVSRSLDQQIADAQKSLDEYLANLNIS